MCINTTHSVVLDQTVGVDLHNQSQYKVNTINKPYSYGTDFNVITVVATLLHT